MDNLEIEKIISKFLEQNEVILKIHSDVGYAYVITVNKNDLDKLDDDRYTTIGGRGPLKVNLSTKEVERIHYLDFPSYLIEEEPTLTTGQIIEKIKRRKYINEKDVFDFLYNEYGTDLTDDYTFFELNLEVIGLEFETSDIEIKFRKFFDEIGARYKINDRGKILVLREV